MIERADTVICGAGIAGVATAYSLAVTGGHGDVVLVDGRQPLSLTTAKSGENYRDYWPQACMRALSTRSIDLMDELQRSTGGFEMRPSGYVFASREAGREMFDSELDVDLDLDSDSDLALDSDSDVAGGDGGDRSAGLERVTDPAAIAERWPHLSPDTEQVVVIDRAGAVDVQALGGVLLAMARQAGVRMQNRTVQRCQAESGGGFRVFLEDGELRCRNLVLATGPFLGPMAAELGVDLPLFNVAQRKFVLPDPLGVVAPDMPFTICADELVLEFDASQRQQLAADQDLRWLLDPLPAGLHIKPEPGGLMKLGWAFNRARRMDATWEVERDELFPNVVMRGAAMMIPGLAPYAEELPGPVIQYGGYYTRTEENWPLIGPTDRDGLYVVGGLAGFGTMSACAAGDLLMRHLLGGELPWYAANFAPDRYDSAGLRAEMAAAAVDGQL